MAPSPKDAGPEVITRLLRAWQQGDRAARDRLFVLVYDVLRRRAGAHLRRERRDHTLRPTALVHETYLRLMGQEPPGLGRAQFFAIASETMRRILVDHARERNAAKRGGAVVRVALEEDVATVEPLQVDLIALDEALAELATMDAQQSRVVEMRFFGGLNTIEIAEVLGVSSSTVERDWRFARTWLHRRLQVGTGR